MHLNIDSSKIYFQSFSIKQWKRIISKTCVGDANYNVLRKAFLFPFPKMKRQILESSNRDFTTTQMNYPITFCPLPVDLEKRRKKSNTFRTDFCVLFSFILLNYLFCFHHFFFQPYFLYRKTLLYDVKLIKDKKMIDDTHSLSNQMPVI